LQCGKRVAVDKAIEIWLVGGLSMTSKPRCRDITRAVIRSACIGLAIAVALSLTVVALGSFGEVPSHTAVGLTMLLGLGIELVPTGAAAQASRPMLGLASSAADGRIPTDDYRVEARYLRQQYQ